MENKKRERTVNFTASETRTLVNIVLKHMDIIENKKTDAVTWKTKNEAWDRVAIEFNAQSGMVHRTSKVLRLKYDVLKRQLKKKQANNKMEIYKTGGGPYVETPLTDFEEKLLQILSLSINGLSSRNDSDMQDTTTKSFCEENEENTERNAGLEEETIILEYVVDKNNTLCPTDASSQKENIEKELHELHGTDCYEVQPTPSTSKVGNNAAEEQCSVRRTNITSEETPRKKMKFTPMTKKDVLYKQYENVAENRNVLLNSQREHFQEERKRSEREHKYKMENLELQRQYLMNEEARKMEEHRLKVEKLKLEIEKLKQNF